MIEKMSKVDKNELSEAQKIKYNEIWNKLHRGQEGYSGGADEPMLSTQTVGLILGAIVLAGYHYYTTHIAGQGSAGQTLGGAPSSGISSTPNAIFQVWICAWLLVWICVDLLNIFPIPKIRDFNGNCVSSVIKMMFKIHAKIHTNLISTQKKRPNSVINPTYDIPAAYRGRARSDAGGEDEEVGGRADAQSLGSEEE